MSKKIISIAFCFIFCLLIIFNNTVISIASDNQDFDYTRFYAKNFGYEDYLVEDKYIVIDSKETDDECMQYYSNWRDACKISSYSYKEAIHEGKYDYPFYIQFLTQKNITHDNIKEILSKYDTNFLFGYTYPTKSEIESIKKYLNDTYYYNQKTETKVSNSVILEKFKGTDEQLIELFKNLWKDAKYSFYIDSEKISDNDYYSLDSAFCEEMYNGESRYYVRFNNKEEYLKAKEELDNNEDIFVEKTFSSNILVLRENSIVVVYDCSYDIYSQTKIDEFEKNLLEIIKEDLSDYDLTYSELLKTKLYINEYILSIENIKEEDLADICSILYRMDYRNHSRDEEKPEIRFYIVGENRCVYSYPGGFQTYKKEPAKNNTKSRYKKVYWIKYSDGGMSLLDDVNSFYRYIIDDCKIYPMHNLKILPDISIDRLYNPNTGEHLFVSKPSEYRTLVKKGWKNESLAFITDDSKTEDLKKVYRVYNPNAKGGDHHYTISYNEAENLVKKGWKWDNNAEPIFYSGGDIEVHRLYNKNNGRHHYTKSDGEKNKLVKLGWKYEGVAWTVLE